MNKHVNNYVFIGLISCFLILGTVIFLYSLTRIVITTQQTSHYEETQGKVVSSFAARTNRGGRTVTHHTPVVEYVVDGNIYQIKGEIQSELRPNTGVPVSIRYNPQNPEEAVFASKLFNMNFFLLFFGFGMSVLSLFILSMEIETKFFARVRLALFYLSFGTMGGGAYLHMGNSIGSFNPFIMIYATPWSLIPCIFLAVVGLGIFFSVRNILNRIKTRQAAHFHNADLYR